MTSAEDDSKQAAKLLQKRCISTLSNVFSYLIVQVHLLKVLFSFQRQTAAQSEVFLPRVSSFPFSCSSTDTSNQSPAPACYCDSRTSLSGLSLSRLSLSGFSCFLKRLVSRKKKKKSLLQTFVTNTFFFLPLRAVLSADSSVRRAVRETLTGSRYSFTPHDVPGRSYFRQQLQ